MRSTTPRHRLNPHNIKLEAGSAVYIEFRDTTVIAIIRADGALTRWDGIGDDWHFTLTGDDLIREIDYDPTKITN